MIPGQSPPLLAAPMMCAHHPYALAVPHDEQATSPLLFSPSNAMLKEKGISQLVTLIIGNACKHSALSIQHLKQWDLVNEHIRRQDRYDLNTSGLSDKSLTLLSNLQNPDAETTSVMDVDDPAMDPDLEWETVPETLKDDATFIHAVWDIVGSQIHLQKLSFSAEAFTKVLCDLYNTSICDTCGQKFKSHGLAAHQKACRRDHLRMQEDCERQNTRAGSCAAPAMCGPTFDDYVNPDKGLSFTALQDALDDHVLPPAFQQDDIRTEYHPHSGIPMKTDRFGDFHCHTNTAHSQVPQNTTPWEPFSCKKRAEGARGKVKCGKAKVQKGEKARRTGMVVRAVHKCREMGLKMTTDTCIAWNSLVIDGDCQKLSCKTKMKVLRESAQGARETRQARAGMLRVVRESSALMAHFAGELCMMCRMAGDMIEVAYGVGQQVREKRAKRAGGNAACCTGKDSSLYISSRINFDFAELILKANLTKLQTNELIALIHCTAFERLSVTDYDGICKMWDATSPRHANFKKEVISVPHRDQELLRTRIVLMYGHSIRVIGQGRFKASAYTEVQRFNKTRQGECP
ncbi:hypothetical protein F4604DRAFT_1688780 [Suillus subluteus]|nr:hypothetical protein F4604DRAFT_1688780 [Suillus subluteus]